MFRAPSNSRRRRPTPNSPESRNSPDQDRAAARTPAAPADRPAPTPRSRFAQMIPSRATTPRPTTSKFRVPSRERRVSFSSPFLVDKPFWSKPANRPHHFRQYKPRTLALVAKRRTTYVESVGYFHSPSQAGTAAPPVHARTIPSLRATPPPLRPIFHPHLTRASAHHGFC